MEDLVGGEYGIHAMDEAFVHVLIENLKERDCMKGIDVGGRINLKLFLKKKGLRGIVNTVMNFRVP
jgi:hypothetical protein